MGLLASFKLPTGHKGLTAGYGLSGVPEHPCSGVLVGPWNWTPCQEAVACCELAVRIYLVVAVKGNEDVVHVLELEPLNGLGTLGVGLL